MNRSVKIFASGILPKHVREKLSRFGQLEVREEPTPLGKKELIEALAECSALMCLVGDQVDAEVMDACPDLKLVANVAVGYDNVDVAAAKERGVLVLNTPGVLDNATADLTFALILSCARRVVEADRYVRDGKWEGWRPDLMLGLDLYGKTLGIVGLGRIGEAVARRSQAFGMKVIYTRKGNEEKDQRISRELGAKRVSLPDLLRSSDFISIHCPLTNETRHLIGRVELSRVKPNCILVNTARGAVVDQEALIAALKTGRMAGAGLDVFEDEPQVPKELIAMRNVVLTPHIGSACQETRESMANLAADGLITAFSEKLPANCVNKDVWNNFVDRLKITSR
ncbi:MAG TPA: D-glycerate dehydrogenase [Chroococcales cyanobacterium]